MPWDLSLISSPGATPKRTVSFGINTDYAMPLVQLKFTAGYVELDQGILKDLAEALTDQLRIRPVWVLLPKQRIASSLISGDAAIVCHLHEDWQPYLDNDVYWSQSLYSSSNVFVSLGKKKVDEFNDLFGERVGTVVNFIYRNVDGYFSSGKIIRENSPNNSSNIQKLLHGRLDFALMSDLEYNYYKKLYPTLNAVDLHQDTVNVKCALSKKAPFGLKDLNAAIEMIKKNGTLDKILKSYP